MTDKLNLLNPDAPHFPDDGYDDLGRHGKSIVYYTVNDELLTEAEFAELKRKQYIETPPEGFSSDEISSMSDDAILDMDYFLNE